jgi:aminoglycoside phosphotransferase family enzyme
METRYEPTLSEKVDFLGTPRVHGPRIRNIDITETHMAWVFLAGRTVYKLKKPVRYSFLDFSTLAAREFYCREEVRLNSRLAPGVYLGVVPLCVNLQGKMNIEGRGQTIDWLVKMRRLPSEKMLDSCIQKRKLTSQSVQKVTDILCDFYRGADKADLTIAGFLSRISTELEEDESVLSHPEFEVATTAAALLDRIRSLLVEVLPLIEERIESGVFVEGHGDLRPEHVCLTDPPVIIDCLEFNRSLRLLDPYDEICYLGMECTRLGASWAARELSARFAACYGRAPPAHLLSFYSCIRALLRARLALAHLLEPSPRTPEKWRPKALDYLALAEMALNSSN